VRRALLGGGCARKYKIASRKDAVGDGIIFRRDATGDGGTEYRLQMKWPQLALVRGRERSTQFSRDRSKSGTTFMRARDTCGQLSS